MPKASGASLMAGTRGPKRPQPRQPAPVKTGQGLQAPPGTYLLQIPESTFQPQASILDPRPLRGEVEPFKRFSSSAETRT